MTERAKLLEELRIDRTAPAERGPRRGLYAGLAVLLALLAAGIYYWRHQAAVHERAEQAAAATAAAAAAATETRRSGPAALLDASGFVVARRQATVSATVGGRVTEVLIDEGSRVTPGQVIARLDDGPYRLALEQTSAQAGASHAQLQAAQTAFDNAQPIYERNQKQHAGGFISAQDFDNAHAAFDAVRSALTVQKRAVDVSDAAVAAARRNLSDTVIRAPFAGVVTFKGAQPGEIISPAAAGGGYTRTGICTIVDMDSLEVEVDVSENFITRVYAAQPATIRLNAYPDWDIPASVIAVIPTADRSKATVKVRVGFKTRDARILPEMGARVSFQAEAT